MLNLGRYTEAIAECEDLLRLCNSDNMGIRYILIGIYCLLEKFDEAEKLFDKYNERITHFLLPMAILYYKKGDYKKTKKFLKVLNETKEFILDYLIDYDSIDEEMIVYYTKMVKNYGGKLTVKWVYGMVICNNDNVNSYSWSKDNFYFVDKPCKKRNPSYPLDSISIIPEFNKYLAELDDEEKLKYKSKDNIDAVVDFIVSNV